MQNRQEESSGTTCSETLAPSRNSARVHCPRSILFRFVKAKKREPWGDEGAPGDVSPAHKMRILATHLHKHLGSRVSAAGQAIPTFCQFARNAVATSQRTFAQKVVKSPPPPSPFRTRCLAAAIWASSGTSLVKRFHLGRLPPHKFPLGPGDARKQWEWSRDQKDNDGFMEGSGERGRIARRIVARRGSLARW